MVVLSWQTLARQAAVAERHFGRKGFRGLSCKDHETKEQRENWSSVTMQVQVDDQSTHPRYTRASLRQVGVSSLTPLLKKLQKANGEVEPLGTGVDTHTRFGYRDDVCLCFRL